MVFQRVYINCTGGQKQIKGNGECSYELSRFLFLSNARDTG